MIGRHTWRIGLVVLVLLLAMGGAAHADRVTHADHAAQAGEGYTLTWWSADGGGGTSAGGNYVLSGAIGQSDAGTVSGGDFTLAGGFWVPFDEWAHQFQPLLQR